MAVPEYSTQPPLTSRLTNLAGASTAGTHVSILRIKRMTAFTNHLTCLKMSSFRDRIYGVRRKRSDEKMLWIDAARIIATMKNAQRAVYVEAQPKHRSQPMRQNLTTFPMRLTVAALFVESPGPVPASRALVEPEAIDYSRAWSGHIN